MGKNNIIEINGKRFDARTGAMLSHPGKTGLKATPQSKPHTPLSKPSMHDVVRQPAKPAAPHQPKPSKTLMRHAVKKPVKQSKSHLKAQGPTDSIVQKPMAEVVVSKSAKRIDAAKLSHASKVSKSHLIAHFTDLGPDTSFQPTPIEDQLPKLPATPPPTSKTKAAKPKTTSELLEHAIRTAKTDDEPAAGKPKRRAKHRVRNTVASVTAVVMLGIVGYQELPNIKLNIASAKAGFSASLPEYQPAGYSVGRLSYGPGTVATKFTSNSDERSYTLTQKTSGWDSQALKDNFIASRSQDFQTVETAGRTIYLYDDGSATWVNGGVWYIVNSEGLLSNHQLVELAKSI